MSDGADPTVNPQLQASANDAIERMEAAMMVAMDMSEKFLNLQVQYDSGIQANNKAGQTFGKIQ